MATVTEVKAGRNGRAGAAAAGGQSPRAKLAKARAAMAAALIERDEEIDLLMASLVAGENVLFIGQPGTAKSLMLDILLGHVEGSKFSALMTRSLNPEELFGPLDVGAFVDEKRWVRHTAGWLPTAEWAFLDEIWEASSAVANTLLKILNEGTFQNDGVWNRVPLRMCVAGSNKWKPDGTDGRECAAMLDRFLFRKSVQPIQEESGRERLWDFDGAEPTRAPVDPADVITLDEIDRMREEARGLPFTEAGKEAFRAVVKALAAEGVLPGDRRQRKAVGACRASAYASGADRVEPEHLEVLSHVLWDSPDEQPEKAKKVVAKFANPVGFRVAELRSNARAVLKEVVPSDFASLVSADGKLGEILTSLAKLPQENPRVASAVGYVKAESKSLRMAGLTLNERR